MNLLKYTCKGQDRIVKNLGLLMKASSHTQINVLLQFCVFSYQKIKEKEKENFNQETLI